MEKLIEFFKKFIAGDFGFDTLKDSIEKFYNTVSSHPDMEIIVGFFDSLSAIMPYITIAVMFLFLFWGKKLLPQIKFVASFAVGFGLGVYFLAPAVSNVISGLPAWVSGLVIGLLMLAIYRIFYVVFFAVFAFYALFTVSYSLLGGRFDTEAFAFIAIAAIGVILAFIFRKYVEMLGTAFLGAFVMLKEIDSSLIAFDLKISIGSAFSMQLISVIAIVLAVIGFIVQFRTRRRY